MKYLLIIILLFTGCSLAYTERCWQKVYQGGVHVAKRCWRCSSDKYRVYTSEGFLYKGTEEKCKDYGRMVEK